MLHTLFIGYCLLYKFNSKLASVSIFSEKYTNYINVYRFFSCTHLVRKLSELINYVRLKSFFLIPLIWKKKNLMRYRKRKLSIRIIHTEANGIFVYVCVTKLKFSHYPALQRALLNNSWTGVCNWARSYFKLFSALRGIDQSKFFAASVFHSRASSVLNARPCFEWNAYIGRVTVFECSSAHIL